MPFFVVDQKYGVSGAQPTEVFSQLLERAWADRQPALEVVGGSGRVRPGRLRHLRLTSPRLAMPKLVGVQ